MSGPFSVNPSGPDDPSRPNPGPRSFPSRQGGPSGPAPDYSLPHESLPREPILQGGATPGSGRPGGGGSDPGAERRNRHVVAAIVVVVGLFVVIGIMISLLLARATGPDTADSVIVPSTTAPSSDSSSPASSEVPQTGDMDTETCRTVDGLTTRECTVVLPPGTPAGAELPAVILLHGFGVPGWEVRSAGRWDQAQKDRDFIVVTPEGPFASWNAGGCCGFSVSTGIDDVGYLEGLVSRVAERPDVDSERIYMVGASNGGMMMWRYLCADDGTIRKAASQAGTPFSDCVDDDPVPTIQIHGTSDLVVPYEGGQSVAGAILNVQFPSVPSALAARADDRICDDPVDSDLSQQVSLRSWTGCAAGADIDLYTLDGGGHDWPTPAQFPATDTILDFFEL